MLATDLSSGNGNTSNKIINKSIEKLATDLSSEDNVSKKVITHWFLCDESFLQCAPKILKHTFIFWLLKISEQCKLEKCSKWGNK